MAVLIIRMGILSENRMDLSESRPAAEILDRGN